MEQTYEKHMYDIMNFRWERCNEFIGKDIFMENNITTSDDLMSFNIIKYIWKLSSQQSNQEKHITWHMVQTYAWTFVEHVRHLFGGKVMKWFLKTYV